MRSLLLVCLFLAAPVFAQDTFNAGKASVAAVVDHYILNTRARLPGTDNPLPSNGQWAVRRTRPDTCPHDDTPCARVLYSVPDANVTCEWTVVPPQNGAPAIFLDQNEDASRYLLRKLSAAELTSLILKSPQPIYPTIARSAHVYGPVVVRLVVSDQGAITSVNIVSGPAMLTGAALDAAQHWTFHPFQVGTQPVPFLADLTANFVMQPNTRPCTMDNPCAGGAFSKATVTMHP